ncbi:AraC family transcriptional regulator [Paenibacillus filicis]|uniref:AraC family transcriptional regulator n=1 Tax=Paenibacillus filicis TaxID=669464 RepID=A0ABU9DHI9_9BACL
MLNYTDLKEGTRGMLILHANETMGTELDALFLYHKHFQYWSITHSHDFYELFLVTKGRVCHVVNGQTERLDEGALVFIRPDDQHGFEAIQDEKVELLNINLRDELTLDIFAFLGPGFPSTTLLRAIMPPVRYISAEQSKALLHHCMDIWAIARTDQAQMNSMTRGLLASLFTREFTERQDGAAHDKAPGWLRELHDHARKNEVFLSGVNALYQSAPFSPEHVARCWKKYYQVTPTHWINEQRLTYAADLIEHSDLEILDICFHCGFGSLSYFYRLFKERFSCTPIAYREKHGKLDIY